MNDDLHTLSGAYALNALPERQQRLFEEHMARCEACLIEVRSLREAAARLGLAAAQEPPPALRSRVLARIAEVRQEPPIVQPGAMGTGTPGTPGIPGGLGAAYDQDPYRSQPTGGLIGHPQDPGAAYPQDPRSPYSQDPGPAQRQDPGFPQDPGPAYRQDPGTVYPQDPGSAYRPGAGSPQEPGPASPQDLGSAQRQDFGASYPPEGTRVYPPETGRAFPQNPDGSYPQEGLDTTQTYPRHPNQPFPQQPVQSPPAEADSPQDQTQPYPREARPLYPAGLGRRTEWRALAEERARQATPDEPAPAPGESPFAPGDRPAVPGETRPGATPPEPARPVAGTPPEAGSIGRPGRSGHLADTGSVLDFDQARRSSRRRGGGRAGWGTRIAAVAATISTAAAVALGYLVHDTNQELNQVRYQSQTVSAILAAPDAKTIVRPVTTGGSATIVRSRSANRVVFTASGLANLPSSKTYELWLMGPDGPRPAGLLQRGADGTVVPVVALPLADEDQLGLTVEPAGGSAKPTTQPILLTKLPSA